MEVPAGGDPKVVAQVVARAPLGLRTLHALTLLVHAMLQARQKVGQAFAEMPKDDLDVRVLVEESAEHQAHRVASGLVAEGPRRTT